MQHWNWGIPVSILEPPGASPQPQAWNELKFNPIGLFDLRRRIGVFASEPGVYNDHRTRFDAADLTWFAAGLSTEVLHLTQNAFPPEFSTLRQTTPTGQVGSHARSALRTRVQKLTFDLVCIIQTCYNMVLTYGTQATLWDRTFGGATLIIHVEGTTRPNAPRRPEYIKSDVYFPGYLIEEDPRLSPIISELVQKYIIDIGMPVIEWWERCGRSIWSMTQGEGGQVPLPYPSQPIQPQATPRGSSTFVYNGRPLSSDRRVVVVNEYEEEELTSTMVELLNVIEERDNFKSQVDNVQSALAITEKALRDSLACEEQLKSELDNTRAMVSTRVDGADSNTIVSRHHLKDPIRHTSPHLHVAPHTSPIPHPTTPSFHDRFDRLSHISPTPPSRRGNAYASPSSANLVSRRLFPNAVASPSRCKGSSESDGSAPAPASRAIDALADYYNFLNSHKIIHLRSTLDVIRHASPISTWALQLEDAGVPLDLIDFVMTLMVAANA